MRATKPATGRRALQEPCQTAWATSSPASPTYMGLRVTEFAPVVTNAEARAGCTGSTVVSCRGNWRAAAPAKETDATDRVLVSTTRPVRGGGVGPLSIR